MVCGSWRRRTAGEMALPRRRAIIVVTAGAMAAGVLVIVALLVVQELRLRWACEGARKALLAAESLNQKPPPGLEDLLASREAGFPVFARLLVDDDPVVWTWTLQVLDMWHEGARKPDWDVLTPLQTYLRDADPLAWVKYQLPEPYQHGTDWRGAGDFLTPDYWSGHSGRPLAPDSRILGFFRDFLEGRDETAFRVQEGFLWPDERRDLERRAVYALRAMLWARPPPGEAVELLRRTAAGHRFPSVRLAALALAESPFGEECACVSRSLWILDEPPDGVRHIQLLAAQEDGAARDEPFHADHQLELLAHLDSSWALWTLVHLREDSRLEDAVARALGDERGRWPVKKPIWLPLEVAAARYLSSPSLDERAAAVLALVDLGTMASRDALARHEARESHAELRLLVRSGLAALGEERHRTTVERELLQRLDAEELEWRKEGRVTVSLRRRWPWRSDGPGSGWAEPYRVGEEHLARHLLLAGSRATLDRMIKLFLEWGNCLVALGERVEGMPRCTLALPPTTMTFTSDAADEEEQRQVREWWHSNGARLLWDGRKRKFTADQAFTPR